jgi:two-component system, OmpR family, phosphate regulon sensor histidine kinase PhoR
VRRPHLFWRLAATYLVIVALCTVALGWYSISSARSFYLAHTSTELQARAQIVERQLAAPLADWRPRDLGALVRNLGAASGTRYTVIAPDGTVLADSVADAATMANHRDRPEVQAALAGGVGRATRESPTLHVQEMYVAVPIEENGHLVGAVRAAVPLTSLNAALQSLYWRIGVSAAILAVVGIVLGAFVSRRISGQMRRLQTGAERFAAGDFAYKLDVPRIAEFGAVAESLNEMAAQLDDKIRTISSQNNEREAILSSMVEAVLAVDRDERIIAVNRAAAELLGIDELAEHGRSIQETVRNLDLQRLVSEALNGEGPVEGEIALRVGYQDRYLQVHATALRDAADERIGAIAVLNDVTRLKSLEELRREFVANVSHEIKTPVTAIKGFGETLLDGALSDPADAERFARIIVGQADRLNALVQDLLSLSHLEQAGGGDVAELHEASLSDVLHVAADVCAVKARAKGVTLRLEVAQEVLAPIDPPLLEQAVVNLVDNAVKYSPEGGAVVLAQRIEGDGIVIEVSDRGIGIAREHLPRLFERFYRVDKARSRDLGGTGLGLAIVKHIAQVHGGRVSVESRLGEGSTFRIHLPRA